MVNVLVTGANGQLANCIKDIGAFYPNLNLIYTDYLELDICNIKQVKIFFKENPPIHYCINCAAYTAVDKAETDVEKAFEINSKGAKNLAISCFVNNTVLIHVSTDFVFDGNKLDAYSETDTTNPISVYGNSKLKGEEEIIKILNNFFIIRTSWLYSEHGSNFLKTMLKLSEERTSLKIVSDQFGTPTYAKDLAKVILNIINSKNNKFGIYHYSNEGETNWYEFAKTFFDFKNIKTTLKPIKTEAYPTPAKRPRFSVLDKTKIKNTFDIKIPYWEDSLKTAISNLK